MIDSLKDLKDPKKYLKDLKDRAPRREELGVDLLE